MQQIPFSSEVEVVVEVVMIVVVGSTQRADVSRPSWGDLIQFVLAIFDIFICSLLVELVLQELKALN